MPQERLTVAPEEWLDAIGGARDRGYTYFDWLSAVDETDRGEDPGLEVVCHLLDPHPGPERDLGTLLARTRVPLDAPLPSITGVFAGAAWHERETHEMFGQEFSGFDDGTGLGMRPLLLPDGFEGTPLRKSFVLAARATRTWPGGKEPGEGHSGSSKKSPSRRRVSAPGVPGPDWGPHPHTRPTPDSHPSPDSHPTPAEPRSKSATDAPRGAGADDSERGPAKGETP